MRLIVEVKRRGESIDKSSVEQLGSFMTRNNCPLGLLVTPDQTWLFRNTYEIEDAIEEIAQFDTPTLLGVSETPDSEAELEQLVGRWLESLTSGSTANVQEQVAHDVARYLLPEVTEGRVESGRSA